MSSWICRPSLSFAQLEEVTTAELAWITQLMGVLDEAWSAYYPDSAIRNLFGLSSMASPQLPVREPDIEAGHEEPAHQQGQGQHGEAGGGGSPVAAMRRRAWARAGRVWQPVQTAVADAPAWKVRLLNSDCRSKMQADLLSPLRRLWRARVWWALWRRARRGCTPADQAWEI